MNKFEEVPNTLPILAGGKWRGRKSMVKHIQKTTRATGRELTKKQAAECLDKTLADQIFVNGKYQVNICPATQLEGWPEMIHLSIKRLDKQPVHDWRELQQIKNELVGPEHEAVELYPAESRLVDAANQFHLWVFAKAAPEAGFGFGFFEGRVTTNRSVGGAVQRPRSEEDEHDDK